MMISVVIPTFKRLPLLKRAVQDVLGQTWEEWELVISDDEVGDGETWLYLQGLAKQDPRIRVIKNAGIRHGQVWNVNNALRECRGDWIKPLFDDDRMLPSCLEKMAAVSQKCTSAVMIGCRAQKWLNGVYASDEKNFCRSDIEVIRQKDCRLAICLFDRWNGRTPTHMMIRADVVRRGVLMPEESKYEFPVDWVWFAQILALGDYVRLRETLVCQCEGEVVSLTAGARANARLLDNELFLAYRDIYDLARSEMGGLSWRAVKAQINGIRGIYHLRQRRFGYGLKMLAKMFASARAPFLVLRWLLQETFPGHFTATKREGY